MAYLLPTFLVLGSAAEENKYLSFIHENKNLDGYLTFSETQAVSPYAKFEVERAQGEAGDHGLVHIRSCLNNKYWERTKNIFSSNSGEEFWITATANKPEEDQSKESCTLFKPILVDSAKNTVRIMHVHSEGYLRSSKLPGKELIASHIDYRYDEPWNIFKVIDWESLLILPKYVAFKGHNGKYLCCREYNDYSGKILYLQFAADDIGDPTVPFEVVVNHDGNIRIKSARMKHYWKRTPDWIWIWPDSDHCDAGNNELFSPIKRDDHTIALKNVGNDQFCIPVTKEGKYDCLHASSLTVTREAHLKVEEPVMRREIHDVRYKLDFSRIYDEAVRVVAKTAAHKHTEQPSALDMKLSYTDTKTTTWKVSGSLKLGAKLTSELHLPLILDGKIEISGEIQAGVEWSNTTTTTTVTEVVNKVVVPPMTKVTVKLVATEGKCDVPFSFIQRDTHYDGSVHTTEVQGGTYTGSNYNNFSFQAKEEPLN